MNQVRNRSIMFLMTILTVLAMSAMQIVPVLADDESPPPPAATEVVPPPEQNPSPEAPGVPVTEAAPAATQEPVSTEVAPAATQVPADIPAAEQATVEEPAPAEQAPSEVLAQLPEGTDIIVLDENNEAVPLASQQAAEIVSSGDPIWCPVGVAPIASVGGCSISYSNLKALVDDVGISFFPAANGVIWITGFLTNGAGGPGVADSSAANVVFNGGLNSTWTTWSNYGLALKGGWTGTGTTINTNDASVFNRTISITNWNGNVTISDIVITNATGGSALNITTTKDINLTRVKSHNNTGTGANLDNSSGSGKVTITSSDFYQNVGTYGLFVQSKGTITLTSVTANQNTGSYGAQLNNTSSPLTPGVTLIGSSFNGNSSHGLFVYSKGLISATDLTASGNGVLSLNGRGVYLNNISGTAGVTLTGTNIFTDNYGTGLEVNSRGAITLNNVIANANDVNGFGAYLDNSSSATVQPITLTGSNQFKYNHDGGLVAVSKGMVTLNNVNASGNLQGDGVYIDTCLWDLGLGACTASPLGGTKLTGTNVFNDNYTTGLNLYTVGTLSLNNVTANSNGVNGAFGYGTYLDNSKATTAKPITLTGTNVFNGNYTTGLYITTKGNITISNLTASKTTNGQGANITNNASGVTSSVTLTGANFFNGNFTEGLIVNSFGAITVSNVTATGNNSTGISLNNAGGNAKPITLSGTNQFSNNTGTNLFLNSTGAIKLNNITASGSLNNYGAEVYTTYNNVSLAAVTLSGTNTFNDNHLDGLHLVTNGIVTLNNLSATNNYGQVGVYIENLGSGSLAPRNVTLTGTGTFNSNAHDGLEIFTYGAIALSNITAIGNGAGLTDGDGVYLQNSDGTLARNVTLTGVNLFHANYGSGLKVYSLGTITASNITANGNRTGSGANLINVMGTSAGVTLTGIGVFNNNADNGLWVISKGAINILTTSLTANSNGIPFGGTGVYLDNVSAAGFQPIKLTGTNIFDGNHTNGIYITSKGAITLNNLTASNSMANMGAAIQNNVPGSTGAVTLTGINTFTNNAKTGLAIASLGSVTVSNLTANANGLGSGGYGTLIDNASAATPQLVTLTGTSIFNGNHWDGLYVVSAGTITTNGLTASNNGDRGASLVNSPNTSQAIKLNGTNTFNNNNDGGLYIESKGAVTINNLTANHAASGWGIQIINNGAGASGNVTLTGFTNASENSSGINILSLGKVTLTKVIADGNGGDGLYVNAIGSITLTCGSFTSNGGDGIQLITPLATLTGVFASGNTALNFNLAGATTYTTARSCPLP